MTFICYRKSTVCRYVFLVLVLVLSACKPDVPYSTALLGSAPNSLDPTGLSEINEVTFVSQICGRLTSVDEFINVEGDLADSWQISSDRRTYIFQLKPERHSVSGSTVTADDVVFSFERISQDPKST
ncbi:MAG: hypothetical protein HY072_07575, partial [Deltaproteobacteria bacterium]|nr:hypothetical protein [Deltaproteobacteria bacterium]